MKPRAGWKIAEGAASARRTDGVCAGYLFTHKPATPYGAFRARQEPTRRGDKYEWLSTRTMTARCFRTLQAAMEATDKQWPMT
jgi:hypothetical protein